MVECLTSTTFPSCPSGEQSNIYPLFRLPRSFSPCLVLSFGIAAMSSETMLSFISRDRRSFFANFGSVLKVAEQQLLLPDSAGAFARCRVGAVTRCRAQRGLRGSVGTPRSPQDRFRDPAMALNPDFGGNPDFDEILGRDGECRGISVRRCLRGVGVLVLLKVGSTILF